MVRSCQERNDPALCKVKVVDAFRQIEEKKKAVVDMADYRTTTAHGPESKQ
ncbi:hypothetical protein NBG4_630013 [Candidatus Sulfobium mesophilum]|uniref:Uncharacterized protein n=1 Tax=Candidatus Sulfobium mesophilum TaxID=2016548 RepID=A0A2U3QJQ3_9BACT|nr:hypothetical protein NBG4_630013 [Candidatus Sulfobium mesophilum]